MSAPKPGALFTQAWLSEVTGVTPRPSWIARKRTSTRPPTPSMPPLPALPVPAELLEEAPAAASIAPPASPAAVSFEASAALAQLAEENAGLRGQIAEMAATMARLRREVLAASEGDLIELALGIAERVVGRELESDPALVVAWAREAIQSLGSKDDVVISVARDVGDRVPADSWGAVGVEHSVQTDAHLGPGMVEVRTPEGTVAAGSEARLAAVGHALGIEES